MVGMGLIMIVVSWLGILLEAHYFETTWVSMLAIYSAGV
jgi:hypothetical protein